MYNLTNLENPVVIFEIDNDDDVRNVVDFCFFASALAREGVIAHPVVAGMGGWEGVESTCYVMDAAEFDAHMTAGGAGAMFVAEQDAVLRVGPDAEGTLYWRDGRVETAGTVQEVDAPNGFRAYTRLNGRTYVVK